MPRDKKTWIRQLHWQILIAMALGVLAGLVGREELADRIGWVGTLFVQLLRMLIVPLIITSIVSGVTAVGGGRDLGRIFSKTFGYFLLSSALAALLALVTVQLVRPGAGAEIEGGAAVLPEVSAPGSPVDILFDLVPSNFFAAAAQADMLAVIFFCIVLGMAIANLPREPRELLTTLFDAGFQAMMKLTQGVMRFLPIGVFALITRLVGDSGLDAFRALGRFMATVTLATTLHLFVTLPLLLILLARIRPSIHFRNMLDALVSGFSTSSSAATLPVTINDVEKKVGVSNRISSFVLPMGSTVNMDGTAIHQCVSVVFIAQAMGIELGLTSLLVVGLTALLVSIGAAAVPSAGLVMMFIVLEAVNLRGPEVELLVGAILAVDRPLDMFRTSVNVFSDSCGAAIIARSEGESEVDTAVVAG